jgi:hypothetical protein
MRVGAAVVMTSAAGRGRPVTDSILVEPPDANGASFGMIATDPSTPLADATTGCRCLLGAARTPPDDVVGDATTGASAVGASFVASTASLPTGENYTSAVARTLAGRSPRTVPDRVVTIRSS